MPCRAVCTQARQTARLGARKAFRRKYPPRYTCDKGCVACFLYPRQLERHRLAGCAEADVLRWTQAMTYATQRNAIVLTKL